MSKIAIIGLAILATFMSSVVYRGSLSSIEAHEYFGKFAAEKCGTTVENLEKIIVRPCHKDEENGPLCYICRPKG